MSNPVGRDRFEDIVDNYGLKVRLKMRKPRTTDSSHSLPTYPNLIRSYIPSSLNQLWVSDITYIALWLNDTTYKFCYLSLILDAYSEEIVGWCIGETLEIKYTIEALKMALTRVKATETLNLIHHSDRGCQYASNDYVALLKQYGVKISMTESGNPKDNAQAERINNTMKNELLKGLSFRKINEVKVAVTLAVEFYNNERPHMSINMMTPSEAAGYTGELAKRWKSYRDIAIKNISENIEIAKNSLPLPSY